LRRLWPAPRAAKGRKRPFVVEMPAGVQSGHPQLIVKRHPHAYRDEVHVRMLDHFVRVGKSVGNPEMLGRFVCSFLAARADRRDLELRERAQGRNVGIAPPAVAHICSNDPDTEFFSRHDDFSFLRPRRQPLRAFLSAVVHQSRSSIITLAGFSSSASPLSTSPP
jgi:hypothetical protein